VLHLLNGDATAAVFPSSLPGRRAVWRDIMVEGPAGADGAARAAVLAPRRGMPPEEYARGWREGQETLARAGGENEVVLWFEQDLFCAVNLWFVLDRLPPTMPVSLVFPHLTDAFEGLGTSTADDFTPLFEQRTRLDSTACAEARALWGAYAGPDPTTLARIPGGGLPFARKAVRLHLGRFPSSSNGLDEIEMATLHELVSGPRAFPALFRAVMHPPPLREHGMGDVQYAAALRDLQPLLTIDAPAAPFADWRVALAPDGREVLGDRLDGLATRLLDRWLGGVHLRPGARLWRWDGSRILRE
jgi:hypothetical protein